MWWRLEARISVPSLQRESGERSSTSLKSIYARSLAGGPAQKGGMKMSSKRLAEGPAERQEKASESLCGPEGDGRAQSASAGVRVGPEVA